MAKTTFTDRPGTSSSRLSHLATGLLAILSSLPITGCNRTPETASPPEAIWTVKTVSEYRRPGGPAITTSPTPETPDTHDLPLLPSLDSDHETAPLPPPLKLLIPRKSFPKHAGALQVNFDDIDLLKALNAEPVPPDIVQYLPAWLTGLNGQTVRLRGWMYPTAVQSGLRGFLFVRDNEICCFGRQAKLYDKVGVILKAGTTTNFLPGRPFDVQGRFVLKPRINEEGELDFLYLLVDAEIVERR